MLERLVFLVVTTLVWEHAHTLVAYDCEREGNNFTTVSLVDVASCTTQLSTLNETEMIIQVLQKKESTSTTVYHCSVNVKLLITRCSTWEDAQMVEGGYDEYLMTPSYEECQKMHRYGEIQLTSDKRITGVKINQSLTFTETLAGSIDKDGNCEGSYYHRGSRSWNDVIVSAKVTVVLRQSRGQVFLDDDLIKLDTGVSCKYSYQSCSDFLQGYATWPLEVTRDCTPTTYDVLYQGRAIKSFILDENDNSPSIIYTIKSDDALFALMITKSAQICHLSQVYQTEHPKLLIQESRQDYFYFKKQSIDVKNMDMFLYINSKFVYVERHIRTQLMSLAANTHRHRCELERELLRTQLSLAKISPTDFAYVYMKGPGYTASLTGETIRLIKCTPVAVYKRPTHQTCYDELPVTYKNRSVFMTPRTHILVSMGIEVTCSSVMGVMYKLENSWFHVYPSAVAARDPYILTPKQQSDWKYEDPGNLAEKGVYFESDMDTLRKQLLYPSSRMAIENIIARSVMSDSVDLQNTKFINLIPENELVQKVKNGWQKTWTFMTAFGQISAGVLGFFIIGKIIKFCIDTIMHGLSLRTHYDNKWVLCASFWDSVTSYLISRKFPASTAPSAPPSVHSPYAPITEDLKCMEEEPSIAPFKIV